jgi:hypothetical protein
VSAPTVEKGISVRTCPSAAFESAQLPQSQVPSLPIHIWVTLQGGQEKARRAFKPYTSTIQRLRRHGIVNIKQQQAYTQEPLCLRGKYSQKLQKSTAAAGCWVTWFPLPSPTSKRGERRRSVCRMATRHQGRDRLGCSIHDQTYLHGRGSLEASWSGVARGRVSSSNDIQRRPRIGGLSHLMRRG